MAEVPGGVRIKDVAAAAGVSVGTVSNVLNRPHMVAVPTRRRVNAVITRLGFVRSESARQLRAGSSRTVAMLVLDVANPYLTDVVRGVEDAVAEAGLVVMLAGSGGLLGREQRYLEMFQQQRVRGLLWNPTNLAPPDTRLFDRLGIPIVFLDRHRERTHSNVAVDDVAGGRIAAEHLLARGHRRIAVVGGPATLAQVEDRRDGAYAAVSRVHDGATSFLTIPTPDLTLRSGRGVADQLLEMHPASRPTGVFAVNDLVAIGLLQGLLAHGVRVPDELAIVGYDDMEFAAAAAVPLTSVRAPRAELGRHAARLLLEGIDHGKPTHLRFEPELVPRASTAPA
ncbi:LacI family DNA-binding transcriptional regulator [Asanoa sp. NPDC050611]|uniref:LacI family DNA-binding transcriptional regulator n=1 Tax=Asanoa sp. NPDC050611 TaxID=3157098 RepID=UPI0033CFF58E